MAAKKKHGHGKFVFGAIIGAAAGAVVALLTAPKSGRETRQDLKDKATELSDDARRQLRKLEGELNKRISDTKKQLSKYDAKTRKEVEKLLKEAEKYKDQIAQGLLDMKKDSARKLDEAFLQKVNEVLDELQQLRKELEEHRDANK